MIVIEGMDGSGKTTLAKQLAKELGVQYFHHGEPPKDFADFRRKCVRSAILFQRPIIQDRSPFISESIYGMFRNREPYITVEKSQEQLKSALGVIIIYCRPERHIHQPKNYDSADYLNWLKINWKRIQSYYDSYMAQMHALRYDWTREVLQPIVFEGLLELCKVALNELIPDKNTNNSDSNCDSRS